VDELDRLQTVVWPAVISGDPKAIDTALKVMARKAKCLGLTESDDA
jgi:hypothetical protein